MASPKPRPSPLSLAVLSLLGMEPLHPYGIQRLLKLWGKEEVVNVGQRANLYRTIDRLQEAGLITVRLTEREEQYPERTVYELTEEGRREARSWLLEMLSTPRNEFPVFPAALSFVPGLTPQELLAALESRAGLLRATLDRIEGEESGESAPLPRVTLLDDEYRREVTAAELRWVTGLIGELRAGTLTWDEKQLRGLATSYAADPSGDAGASG
ncbi:MAG TPA: PadR family transcriptional regulator [Candidatus Dormibacteraeota bacterium]|nr:PadR family transcriptional regulator [Candidatus Dormibacteraeota bacterium]